MVEQLLLKRQTKDSGEDAENKEPKPILYSLEMYLYTVIVKQKGISQK